MWLYVTWIRENIQLSCTKTSFSKHHSSKVVTSRLDGQVEYVELRLALQDLDQGWANLGTQLQQLLVALQQVVLVLLRAQQTVQCRLDAGIGIRLASLTLFSVLLYQDTTKRGEVNTMHTSELPIAQDSLV